MAGPTSAMVRGLRRGAKKVTESAPDVMSKLDEFLQSVGDPNNITDDQLRQWEALIPELNGVDRSRGSKFLGLDPQSKFPNKRILGRAGIGDPDPIADAMENPLWAQKPDMQQTISALTPEDKAQNAIADAFGKQVTPARSNEAADAFSSQVAPGGMQGPGMMSRAGGAIKRHPLMALGGAGVGALAGYGMSRSGSGGGMPSMQEPKMGRSNAVGPSPSPMPSLPRPTGGGGMRRPQGKSPMLSGLTGQNGAGPLPEMDFGAPDLDFTEMFKQADTAQNAEMQPQKEGNGMMDLLKTIGPLLAALFAGKMMG